MKGTDWQMFRDVREAAGSEVYHTDAETDCRVSPNVGDMMAAVLAAAGSYALVVGGSTACETDYLAASGAMFPSSVTREEMEDFNRRTLREDMDEAAEQARYAAIAGFFGRGMYAV